MNVLHGMLVVAWRGEKRFKLWLYTKWQQTGMNYKMRTKYFNLHSLLLHVTHVQAGGTTV